MILCNELKVRPNESTIVATKEYSLFSCSKLISAASEIDKTKVEAVGLELSAALNCTTSDEFPSSAHCTVDTKIGFNLPSTEATKEKGEHALIVRGPSINNSRSG